MDLPYVWCVVKKQKIKNSRPYVEIGCPSYGICNCGIEYGYDCNADTTENNWNVYREKCLNDAFDFENSQQMSKSQKNEIIKKFWNHY